MERSEACSVSLGVDWTWQISSHCSDRGHNEAGETLFYKRGVYGVGRMCVETAVDSQGQYPGPAPEIIAANTQPVCPARHLGTTPLLCSDRNPAPVATLSFGGQVLKEFTLPDAIFCPFPHVSTILPSILFGTCSSVTIVMRVSLVPQYCDNSSRRTVCGR